MSEQERHQNRADVLKDEGDSTTEEETPDVEAHRMEEAGRVEASRVEDGTETEDRHRSDLGI